MTLQALLELRVPLHPYKTMIISASLLLSAISSIVYAYHGDTVPQI